MYGYDNWKLATPPEYDTMGDDPGEDAHERPTVRQIPTPPPIPLTIDDEEIPF